MFTLGTVPFSSTSTWNQATPTNSTFTKVDWPSSNGYNYSVAWDAYSPAVYVASASDPLVQVSVPGGWGYPGGVVSVHMPAAANGAAGTDGELVVIDGDVAYNFWQFSRTGSTTAQASSYGAENIVTGDGWGSKSPFLSAGTTAVGASELGGLLVKAETDQGQINHALQLVVDSKLVKSGFTGDAIAGDGSSASGIVQEGDHLGIPPDTPMPAGLSPLGQEVFRAMQQYGAYVVDVAGGVTNVRAQANAYDAATMTALWHDMGNITPLLHHVSSDGASATSAPASTSAPAAAAATVPTSASTAAASPSSTSANGVIADTGTLGAGTGQPSHTVGAGQPDPAAASPVAVTDDAGNSGDSLAVAAATGAALDNLNSGAIQPSQTAGAGQTLPDAAVSNPVDIADLSGTPAASSGSTTGNSVAAAPPIDQTVGAGSAISDPTGSNLGGVNDPGASSVGVAGTATDPSGAPAPTNGATVENMTTAASGRHAGTITLDMSDKVTVNGTPSLLLDNGQTAAYTSGSGTSTLTFAYDSYHGSQHAGPAVSGLVLPASSSITDSSGNEADLSGAGASSNRRGFSVVDGSGLELFGASKDFVAFRPGAGGELTLDASSQFTGRIAGFSGDDKLDLADISFGNTTTLGYAENPGHTGGTLTVSDGALTAKIALLGQYAASSFVMSADTSGGTLIQAAAASPLAPTLTKPHSA
jgi:hypothetical protein